MFIDFRGWPLHTWPWLPTTDCFGLQVVLQTWFFLSYFMDALAVAASGIVADSLGRSDVQRARAAAERCVAFGMATAAVLCLLLITQPAQVAVIFSDSQYVLHGLSCNLD
jgi:Na+-driven multidrug efflux pump